LTEGQVAWRSYFLDNATSSRPRLAKGAAAFVDLFAIVPAGGTSAANYSKREIRHILALGAVIEQAERLACICNVQRLRTIRQPSRRENFVHVLAAGFWPVAPTTWATTLSMVHFTAPKTDS
jgi:hypothetical protein